MLIAHTREKQLGLRDLCANGHARTRLLVVVVSLCRVCVLGGRAVDEEETHFRA
jgi:hypothetical protein